MLAKFNLYDFIANLIPGLVFLWCISLIAALLGAHLPIDLSGGLAETSILVALGYVAGLLLQAASERFVQRKFLLPKWGGFHSARWLLPEDTHFSKAYKDQLNTLLAERFKISMTLETPSGCAETEGRNTRLRKAQELFSLCYHYVDNLSPRPQIFNAQYGLFRCLFGLFALLGALSILGIIVALIAERHTAHLLLLLSALFGTASWLSYERCEKHSEDFAQSVYALFVAGVAGKPSDH
jgi:hypothetical protein